MPTQLQRSRDLAFHRQGGKCFYCDVTMSPPDAPRRDRLRCTAEHLQPRSEGGSDAPINIVAACDHCNRTRHRRKRPLGHSEYREAVLRRIARGQWHPRWVFERRLFGSFSPTRAGA
jgi:5-methylcytosine-specific restriction endonuclease McrA